MKDEHVQVIRQLAADGAKPSQVFRRMLSFEEADQSSRMWLFKQLKTVFDMPVSTMSVIGGWSYWDSTGYVDEEIDQRVGKLHLK